MYWTKNDSEPCREYRVQSTEYIVTSSSTAPHVAFDEFTLGSWIESKGHGI